MTEKPLLNDRIDASRMTTRLKASVTVALILDQEDVVQLVGFQVGHKLFGANILSVNEILRDPAIDGVASAPHFVKGVVRLRGTVTPVVDLAMVLGMPESDNGREKAWVLIGQAGSRNVGFMVDGVTPILRIQSGTILPAPDLITCGLRGKYIQGVCETERGLVVIVNLDHMFLDDEIEALKRIKID